MESSLRFFAVRPRTLTYLGYARLDLGELDRARDAAQRAVEFCARTDRKGDEANTFALLGEIHLRETPARLDAAESALTTSLAIAEQLGMKPCIARLHHSWARLETDLGNATAAARHHVIAIDLSRTLNLAPRSPEPRSSA